MEGPAARFEPSIAPARPAQVAGAADDDAAAGEQPLEQLAARMRGGDPRAFTSWARALHPLVYRLCRRLIANPAEAEDAVQDTFLRAWRAAPMLRDPAAHRGWLCQLARRACVDRARSASTRTRPTLELADLTPADHAGLNPQGRADEALMQLELRADLATALAKINDRHRVILLLREVDELSYAEIADALGIPRGTVESRLHRARAALGRALDRHRRSTERTHP